VIVSIDVLGLPVKSFGVLFALSFVACGLIIGRRMRELGKPVDWAGEMVFAALGGGLVGARVYYLAQNPDVLDGDALGAIFGGAGLVWYGGLAGGALAVVAWAGRRRLLALPLLDLAAPALAVGYAIGRVACQISGDGDYGQPSTVPWAMGYPDGAVPTPEGATVQPTPIYETLVMGTVGYLLWAGRDRFRPGILFALYLIAAAVERFLIEFVRRNDAVVAGLTAAQVESVVLACAGAAMWVWLRSRGSMQLGVRGLGWQS
jgi:phosphatidylglycerol---prolipoprotein diacylglyceryl transferase